MARDRRRVPEIQTAIDECADGSWQGTIYVGSILHLPSDQDHAYIGGATFLDCALRVNAEILRLLSSKKPAN